MAPNKELASLFTSINKMDSKFKANYKNFTCYVKNCVLRIYKVRTANFREPVYCFVLIDEQRRGEYFISYFISARK